MLERHGQLAALFFKLGAISFGGPAAHLAIMEEEVVRRREWLSRDEFLDLMGVTHLLPGPNAVEMAAHVGYRRAGFVGSLVAGTCFTLPAVLIAAGLAWGYVQFGKLPAVGPVLDGIKPAVLAVIFAAVWRLGRRALATWQTMFVGAGVAVAFLLGSDAVIALVVGTLAGVLLLGWTRREGGPPVKSGPNGKTAGLFAGLFGTATAGQAQAASASAGVVTAAAATAPVPLWKLGLFFLKVAAVMYGGGYVLVAYIEGGLVGQYGFTQQQLLDAVAVGQITPGPMLSTATFVGYILAGFPGAAVATLGMLLPCFAFVTLANPWIPKLRSSPVASRFLDAVNAAAIGLMAAVTVTLSAATLVHWPGVVIFVAACVVAVRWRVAPAWLVLGGAAAGLLLGLLW